MRFRLVVLVMSVVAVVAATLAVNSFAATPVTAELSTPALPGTAAPPVLAGDRTHRAITLLTGDRVDLTIDASGRISATVPRPKPGSAPFWYLRSGPHFYVIPRSAAPKLGHTLSLSQFDVSAPSTPVLTPHFVMHTLTVHGIDAAGRPAGPDSALGVSVTNVDDGRKFFGAQGFFNGVVKFSTSSATSRWLSSRCSGTRP